MIVTEPRRRTLNGTTQAGSGLERAIRGYVRAYVRRHGRRKTAEDLGVSRHTLWRFLERGHMGRAVTAVVLNAVGGNIATLDAAILEVIIDLEGLRPDPALRPLREGFEEALLLLSTTPLTTVWMSCRALGAFRPPHSANALRSSPIVASWATHGVSRRRIRPTGARYHRWTQLHKYNSAGPTTSCRGCPSMAAGTLLQEFSTLHAPYTLTCSICCRYDTSKEVLHTAHPLRLSAMARSDTRPIQDLDKQTHEATGALFHHHPRPVPTVSCKGAKGHSL